MLMHVPAWYLCYIIVQITMTERDPSSSIDVTNSQASFTDNDYSNSVYASSNVVTSASLNNTHASKHYIPFGPHVVDTLAYKLRGHVPPTISLVESTG